MPDIMHDSPTALRMILGRQLQALREQAGLSCRQAADSIYASEWTIRRIEAGKGALKPLNVKMLLVAYGLTDVQETGAFPGLARDASRPGWWHSYSDVLPEWFKTALGLEESASRIRAYEPQVVPGLLQTGAYARAITAASFPSEKGEDSERRVAVRLARQDLLMRPTTPEYRVVLEETVLRRPIGGPKVMRGQVQYLIECAARPDITIQLLPFTAGWHPARYGMFNVFHFPDDTLPDVVYGEALTSACYLNKPEGTSDNGGSCLEARKLPSGRVALRQGAGPDSPAPILEPDEIRAFVLGAKAGLADDLVTRPRPHRRQPAELTRQPPAFQGTARVPECPPR